ncbi:MAG: 4Fe-4S binding protein [Methanobacterium sp.]|nr:4Fe-4S binding protein [Methanobacterium sp.]
MNDKSIKEKVIDKCKELGIPFVGFAPVERWSKPPKELPNNFNEWIPEEFWPNSIYPDAKTVIVIGLPVQLPIVETAPSIYYHEHYKTVNILLDTKAYEISNFLTEMGYPSIYLPRDGYGDIDILLKNPITFFSHKHAAFLAGMGSFGENNVLLTKEYGPRVRFTSIFTTTPIEGDNVTGVDLCKHCQRCVSQCPVNAIHESKGSKEFPLPMDKIGCATRSKELRKKYTSPCGICIKICPIGNDRNKFNRKDLSIYSDKNGTKYNKAWDHVKKYGSN